jgi:hypothetical protein
VAAISSLEQDEATQAPGERHFEVARLADDTGNRLVLTV